MGKKNTVFMGDENGDMREEINCRWRHNLFNICVVLAVIGSAAEIVIYLIDSNIRTLFLPDREYRFRFIYKPSALNVLVIVLTYFHLKSKKVPGRIKNIWSCVLIYFLCANTQVIHYVYGPLLMLPVIAIFFSVIFGDRALTRCITAASLVSLAIAGYMGSIELRKGDPQLLSDIGLAALVIIVAHIGATLMDAYIIEQYGSIFKGNERQKQLIEELHIDPLMGIYNRMALDEKLVECEKEVSSGKNTFLMMIDIDDFKKINDNYGHLKGDMVLMSLSEIIRIDQGTDYQAYRYGGEEIVLVFSDSAYDRVYEEGERIRTTIQHTDFEWLESGSITISAGIAGCPKGHTSDEWLQTADDAMYYAKRHGKNRVVSASEIK